MITKQAIADKLHKLRDESGYSLSELSERTGIVKQTLQSYEIGRNGITMHTLEKVIVVYGYSLSKFIAELED